MVEERASVFIVRQLIFAVVIVVVELTARLFEVLSAVWFVAILIVC